MPNDRPLAEEYFVCTVRPDSCHVVTRYNEDGETKQMIHFLHQHYPQIGCKFYIFLLRFLLLCFYGGCFI